MLHIPVSFAGTWAVLPGLNRQVRSHALAKLPLVRAALAGTGAALACFHVGLAGRRRAYSCTLWHGDAAGGFRVEQDVRQALAAGTLSEICGGLSPLAQDLARRWPDRARPDVIGVATDGHRVLFNADHPSCHGTGWLDHHLSGRSPCAIVADDGTPGVLEAICPTGGTK